MGSLVGGGKDVEVDGYIEEDGTHNQNVVEIGADEFHNPAEGTKGGIEGGGKREEGRKKEGRKELGHKLKGEIKEREISIRLITALNESIYIHYT